jgi:hypothetical protein
VRRRTRRAWLTTTAAASSSASTVSAIRTMPERARSVAAGRRRGRAIAHTASAIDPHRSRASPLLAATIGNSRAVASRSRGRGIDLSTVQTADRAFIEHARMPWTGHASTRGPGDGSAGHWEAEWPHFSV